MSDQSKTNTSNSPREEMKIALAFHAFIAHNEGFQPPTDESGELDDEGRLQLAAFAYIFANGWKTSMASLLNDINLATEETKYPEAYREICDMIYNKLRYLQQQEQKALKAVEETESGEKDESAEVCCKKGCEHDKEEKKLILPE